MVALEDLREEARLLLEQEKVKYIIGYRRGPDGRTAAPFFAARPEDAARLIWDPTCVHNLVRFARDEKRRRGKEKEPDRRPVGIFVKGCDSRAVNVLLQEKFIAREEVYLIGVSCEKTGVVDDKKLTRKMKGAKVDSIERRGETDFVVTVDGAEKCSPTGASSAGPASRWSTTSSSVKKRSGSRRNPTDRWKRWRPCRPRSAGPSGRSSSDGASAATPAAASAPCVSATSAWWTPSTWP